MFFDVVIKDTDAYEMGQMVYLEFRVVLDGKKSQRPAVLTVLESVSNRHM